jgi:hypothetical protein
MTTRNPREVATGSQAREIGTDPVQTRAQFAGTVDGEGGGTPPHPLGGGAGRTRPQPSTATPRGERA